MATTFVPKSKISDAPVQEYGAMIALALAATTAQVIVPPGQASGFQTQDRQDMRVICRVVGKGVIRLNYEFSPDQGTTWYVGKQAASAVITVDGDAAGFVNAAELDIPVGYWWRVSVYNTTAGAIDIVGEWRYYSAGG